jgi:hypothetical protein
MIAPYTFLTLYIGPTILEVTKKAMGIIKVDFLTIPLLTISIWWGDWLDLLIFLNRSPREEGTKWV